MMMAAGEAGSGGAGRLEEGRKTWETRQEKEEMEGMEVVVGTTCCYRVTRRNGRMIQWEGRQPGQAGREVVQNHYRAVVGVGRQVLLPVVEREERQNGSCGACLGGEAK